MRANSFEPRLLRWLDGLTEGVGRAVAWLIIIMMLVQFAIVVLRYVIGANSIVMQESVMYMHAAVFMLGAAWTLKHDGHVRVDIFYRKLSSRARAWIDLLGTLFLLVPVSLFIAIGSFHYVLTSWAIMERSPNAGIPAVYLLKSLILAMVALLLLQAVAQLIRQTLIIRGALPNPTHEHEEVV
ncbi:MULTISPECIES: TRAP transporter small permease subunit [unclassified Halomonas]|uniref:TRAP transporter small permease subunit n=1 Tax=unclassified Halomonas TaxID=2609666 RepID=UPI0021E3DCF4|nr:MULTISPECIES: TRAP transporter small permease subunit [unclassified Halomonas]UYF99801.1 TRAP transporter small permease subunit [Halomonas sp. GD1P12]WNL39106.1 TRAP transporter small permease subunit [Halomonas sp. PAMB 3232]WNL42456.1 TRAP transporter small permease subunit [Halomonas sp. PAMB 3264]